MEQYIRDFLHVIRNCSVDNTYKMAWGKSIVESCLNEVAQTRIPLDALSRKVFKYYWNQTIFFDLQQSPNPNKPPEFITYVKELIHHYQIEHGSKPVMFNRVEHNLNLNERKMTSILKKDVSWRFLKVDGTTYPLYSISQDKSSINLFESQAISEHSDVLLEAINYRWTQILENFNSSPRISKKVRIIDLDEVKRASLGKFRKYLDQFGDTCFICNQKIENETPSIDHVIPWSYMYSDDLWNLVYAHRACNSSKLDKLVDESEIKKLELRNKKLLDVLREEGIKDKHSEELSVSLERNYPRKFWIGFMG